MYPTQIVETSVLFKENTEWDSTHDNFDIRCPINKRLNTADSFFQGVIYNGNKSENRSKNNQLRFCSTTSHRLWLNSKQTSTWNSGVTQSYARESIKKCE